MSLSVVILAAGQGKRMYTRLPKVLHRVGGETLIGRVIETARTLKPRTICVVYGYGGRQVPEAISAPDITLVRQAPQLGTGHALKQALPKLAGSNRTLVLYGDVPLIRAETLAPLVNGPGERIMVLTTVVDAPFGYGRVVRDRSGQIRRIVEEADATSRERRIREINTGIMTLPTRRLAKWLGKLKARNAQGEYYLPDVLPEALTAGVPVAALVAADSTEALGVNSREQLAQVERIHQRRCAQRLLELGTTLADPERLDIRGELTCGKDVAIDINCVFEGRVMLQDEARVGPGCVLRNVEVGPRTVIEPYSVIEEAVIGADCRIGPYSRIRPGARLANSVHIGNFVEVKNSSLGEEVKANHLAYLGDAKIGARVNIGAGTITCNYDGVNKHETTIEEDAFIGSNTALVAPVTVRRGSTIGAGSTITREAPADQLTLARGRQVSISGWKRPKKRVKGDA